MFDSARQQDTALLMQNIMNIIGNSSNQEDVRLRNDEDLQSETIEESSKDIASISNISNSNNASIRKTKMVYRGVEVNCIEQEDYEDEDSYISGN